MVPNEDMFVVSAVEPSLRDATDAQRSDVLWLAWAGWSMRIPAAWRPLKLNGQSDGGSMMIGDSTQAAAQIKWWRPKRDFEPNRWARERGRPYGSPRRGNIGPFQGPPIPQRRDLGPQPDAAGFRTLIWQPLIDSPGGGGSRRSIWCGHSSSAELVLEIVVNAGPGERIHRRFCRLSLPSLRARRRGGPTPWAVFGTSFRSPPEFVLTDWKLNVGHMVLRLAAPGGGRLVLRQVYPAGLALGKRKLADWLRFYGFRESRKYCPDGPAEPWSADSFGRRLEGVIRRGRKRFPFPLGHVCPRHTAAVAVIDNDLERLLLAECDSPKDDCDERLAWSIGAMNWAQFDPAGEPAG